ncbi:MAG: VCBS repeat-containing protein [Planctomycetes bacterium]|nr:VCBS repeat-containing protein [Planctomycetota bacterium]
MIHSWAGLGAQDYFGYALAAAGDVDVDGVPDVVVGAPESSELYEFGGSVAGPGYVQVISGLSGVVIHHVAGPAADTALGEAVDGGEDVDGDSVPDVIAGGPQKPTGGTWTNSCALVISGATGATICLHTGDWQFGDSCALLGDVDGDGRSDYAIGKPNDGNQSTPGGFVYACSGQTGALLWQRAGIPSGEQLGWSMRASADDVLQGETEQPRLRAQHRERRHSERFERSALPHQGLPGPQQQERLALLRVHAAERAVPGRTALHEAPDHALQRLELRRQSAAERLLGFVLSRLQRPHPPRSRSRAGRWGGDLRSVLVARSVGPVHHQPDRRARVLHRAVELRPHPCGRIRRRRVRSQLRPRHHRAVTGSARVVGGGAPAPATP